MEANNINDLFDTNQSLTELNKDLKDKFLIETYYYGITDSNGNIYPDIITDQFWVVNAYTNDACVNTCVTRDGAKFFFHLSDFNNQNIGSGIEKYVYYIYRKK